MQTQLPTTIRERMKTMQLPVIYEEACMALVACRTIDEAQFHDKKADLLALWAKFHKNERAAVEAARLKLHAYRRMGKIAEELRPSSYSYRQKGKGSGSSKGSPIRNPAATALLQENGFTRGQAITIRRIAKYPENSFSTLIAAEDIPSPSMVASWKTTDMWREWSMAVGGIRALCRKHSPAHFAAKLTVSEASKARILAIELGEWLDLFERSLPKDIPQS